METKYSYKEIIDTIEDLEQVIYFALKRKEQYPAEVIEDILSIYSDLPFPKTYQLDKRKTMKEQKEMALEFYKSYNMDYYKKIINSLKWNRISINNPFKKGQNYCQFDGRRCFISDVENNNFVYIMTHELGHYIDANFKKPRIEPLVETASYYHELLLDDFLIKNGETSLVENEVFNRINALKKLYRMSKKLLEYYSRYKNHETLINTSDENEINQLMQIKKTGFHSINYNMRYLIGYICASYLYQDYIELFDENTLNIIVNENHGRIYNLFTEYQEKINSEYKLFLFKK